jgi:Na+/proline symporter
MLLWFVILYWIVSVAIGLIASLKVKNVTDFAAAGHALQAAGRHCRHEAQ